MSEDQIERRVERLINVLDSEFMGGRVSQAGYDKAMRQISAWADAQYASMRKWVSSPEDRLTANMKALGKALSKLPARS